MLRNQRPTLTNHVLSAANGSDIKTYGLQKLVLNLGLRRAFSWSFIIADVSMPIIGSDFLAFYHLLPDCRLKRLVDGTTGLYSQGNTQHVLQDSVKAVNDSQPYADLLAEFPDATRPPGTSRNIKHNTVHFIRTTTGPPVHCRPRRLVGHLLETAKSEYAAMLQEGSARPSDSPWSSPLHLVTKKGGTGFRPCGDYRFLNHRTIPDSYPVRHIHDFAHNIAGCKIFALIDLVKAYQQIPVHPDDVCKTAVATPFGLFEFPYMPFGLRNAAQTFQRFMDGVVRGLDFCFCYIDDVLVFSRNIEEHRSNLRTLLSRLAQYSVVINPAKCIFEASTLTFLGYKVSAEGISPPEERVEALRSYPKPATIKECRRFLGMYNFYRRHLPKTAELQAPLHEALAGPKMKGSTPFPWTPAREAAFNACKEHLASATLLTYPVDGAHLALFVDASLTSVGGAMQQYVNDTWQPLAFFSKKLSQRQSTWPAYHRELLAVYEGVRHFRHALEGQVFTIYTDHKPLIYVFTQKHDKMPPVQRNHVTFISQYSTDIRHLSGVDNQVADAFSRINAISFSAVDFKTLSDSQQQDDELRMWSTTATPSSLVLEKVSVPGTDIQLTCDTSTGRPRPFVPAPCRRRIFDQIHGLSHPGTRTTVKLVTERYVWPSVKKDVTAWTRACLPCQRSKVTRHVTAPLGHFANPSSRFAHVHIDLIGPLPPSKGFKYCLTFVDRWTRWPEVYPLADITADTVTLAFLTCWVARFGVPERVTCDRGSQFRSHLFRDLAQQLGFELCPTVAYRPCANGQVERLHRQLKAAIMCHDNIHWVEALPFVLLGIRTAFKDDIEATTAELVYGENLRLPGDLVIARTGDTSSSSSELLERLRQHFSKIRPIPASRHANPGSFIFRDLATASHVLLRVDRVRRSLEAPYIGPFRVISWDNAAKTVTLEIKGKPNKVSIDRVKPAYIVADDSDNTTCPVPARPAPPSAPATADLPPVSPAPPSQPPPPPELPPAAAPPPSTPERTRRSHRVRFPPDRFIPG